MYDKTTIENVIERQIILRDLYKIEVSHYYTWSKESGHMYQAWVYTITDKKYPERNILQGEIIWNTKIEAICEGIDWALVYLQEKAKEEWKT